MSDIEQKRQFVLGLGRSHSWKEKVKKMPDNQVVAIYLREQRKPKKAKKPKESQDDIPF